MELLMALEPYSKAELLLLLQSSYTLSRAWLSLCITCLAFFMLCHAPCTQLVPIVITSNAKHVDSHLGLEPHVYT